MKNFKSYIPEKYASAEYKKVEDGIYLTKNPYLEVAPNMREVYVTSLTFEQEPEQYGEEDGSPCNITQFPLEAILDMFQLFVTDFYEELNEKSEFICYQEFGSDKLENIQKLRTIIGKRIYAVQGENDDTVVVE